MSRINIYEKDLTTAVTEASSTDVVYVPGFGTARITAPAAFSAESTYAVGDEVTYDSKYYKCITAITTPGAWDASKWEEFEIEFGVGVNIPTLCNTVAEFEAAFGTTPALFHANQEYPSAFDTKAKPTSTTWFLANSPDPSYIYAKELLQVGLPVVYERLNTYSTYDEVPSGSTYDVTVTTIYNNFSSSPNIFNKLSDKGTYSIKYLTTGGYPIFEYNGSTLATALATVAKDRGDCVALIDHTDKPDRALTGTNSVFASISGSNKISDSVSSFASMFTPWYISNLSDTYADVYQMSMPGSFGYLKCLGKSIKTNVNWLAIAGIARGYIPDFVELHIDKVLSNAIAEDTYQTDTNVAINPITLISPTGYCIWGNRTLKDNSATQGTTALSFLNIRNTISDIKKTVFTSARNLMFEQNTDVLWIRFKAQIMPLLDRMKSGGGLKDYKIIKNSVNPDTNAALPKSKLSATIRLIPEYAVEKFDIYLNLTDEDVTVE